jgi:hypothetical protein
MRPGTGGWVDPGPVLTGAERLDTHRNLKPGLSSQALYRLSHRGPHQYSVTNLILVFLLVILHLVSASPSSSIVVFSAVREAVCCKC